MTARDLAVCVDNVLQILRERNLIKVDGTTHPALDPIARLTATLYIQAQRRDGAHSPSPPAAVSPAADGVPASPPKMPPESTQGPPREGDTRIGPDGLSYSYHSCPACGRMELYKKWWPKAECLECFKKRKRAEEAKA